MEMKASLHCATSYWSDKSFYERMYHGEFYQFSSEVTFLYYFIFLEKVNFSDFKVTQKGPRNFKFSLNEFQNNNKYENI